MDQLACICRRLTFFLLDAVAAVGCGGGVGAPRAANEHDRLEVRAGKDGDAQEDQGKSFSLVSAYFTGQDVLVMPLPGLS